MKIRIGTRKSKLALVQTGLVKKKIEELFPEADIALVEMSTKGDEQLNRSLDSFGGKGVFTKELEEALLTGDIDLAVHSAKDMPMEFPEGLHIGAVLARANPQDVFVTTSGVKAKDLKPGSIVGTSSLRRELQIKSINPQVQIQMLRGNVQTRLKKLKEGQYDGILLAAAGLERLGLTADPDFHYEYLELTDFLPAAGQGILAVESKKGHLEEVLKAIHSEEAGRMLAAERSFLTHIDGSCNAPAAAYSEIKDGTMHMRVLFAKDGVHPKMAEGEQAMTGNQAAAEQLGKALAQEVKKGKVYLVGAGPGDVGLMSRKGLACVQKADVVVYDNLVSNSMLNEAREDAELIYAGKRAANHHLKQEETNALLVEKALEGKTVARLKGGDPFVFGRGGEEAQELLAAGIPFEIIPGISSSYAAAAYAGIPVTHRDFASSFHVITGHEKNHKTGNILDYATLAKEEGTLIFLMGLHNLSNITRQLMEHGKDPKTPAAVIQEGTTARQKTAVGTLATIVEEVARVGIQTPAATVIGDVVSLKEPLSWYGEQPLFGKRVLLTGTKQMVDTLAEELLTEGAEPVAFSLIQTRARDTEALSAAMQERASITWMVFTSSNGVDIFFDYLLKERLDLRSLSHVKFAVIGAGTKKALEQRGIQADFVPSKYSSKDLAAEWIPGLTGADQVCLLRAREASHELNEALEAAGIAYRDIALYETHVDRRKEEELNRMLPEMDYVIFASASAVKAYQSMVPDVGAVAAKVLCIGPVTAKAAREAGIAVHKTAAVYTAAGLKDVLLSEVL